MADGASAAGAGFRDHAEVEDRIGLLPAGSGASGRPRNGGVGDDGEALKRRSTGRLDLHIKAGDVFRARINGKTGPAYQATVLTPDQTKAIALKLISSEEDRARIDRMRDSIALGHAGVGRGGVNVLRQRSSF